MFKFLKSKSPSTLKKKKKPKTTLRILTMFLKEFVRDMRIFSTWIKQAIELKPNTEPPYMRTYNMSPAELKTLDEYINDALAKGRIQESTSSAGAPVLFIPRKSDELRLCADYGGLNAITNIWSCLLD